MCLSFWYKNIFFSDDKYQQNYAIECQQKSLSEENNCDFKQNNKFWIKFILKIIDKKSHDFKHKSIYN